MWKRYSDKVKPIVEKFYSRMQMVSAPMPHAMTQITQLLCTSLFPVCTLSCDIHVVRHAQIARAKCTQADAIVVPLGE